MCMINKRIALIVVLNNAFLKIKNKISFKKIINEWIKSCDCWRSRASCEIPSWIFMKTCDPGQDVDRVLSQHALLWGKLIRSSSAYWLHSVSSCEQQTSVSTHFIESAAFRLTIYNVKQLCCTETLENQGCQMVIPWYKRPC